MNFANRAILHVYKDYYPPVYGGIEKTISTLAQGAKIAGFRVAALVAQFGGEKTRREEIDGVEVVRVRQWGRFASAPVCPAFPRWLRKLGRDVDVLHFHFPNPTGEIAYLLSGLRKRAVLSYYSDIVRQRMSLRFYRPLLDAFLGRMDVICPLTERYMAGSPALRAHAARCRPIPLGIAVERFAAPPPPAVVQDLRTRYGGPFVLFVGEFRHYKGVRELLLAMKATEGVPLVMIGGGALYDAARRWVEGDGLGDRVHLLGRRTDEEVLAHLHACGFLVLPSTNRAEAYGLVLLEAMACGKAVISTELGTGTSWVNLDGRTGLVVSPGDVAALGGAIAALAAEPALCARLGEEGRRRVRETFSHRAMVDAYLKVYADLLAAPASVGRADPSPF